MSQGSRYNDDASIIREGGEGGGGATADILRIRFGEGTSVCTYNVFVVMNTGYQLMIAPEQNRYVVG